MIKSLVHSKWIEQFNSFARLVVGYSGGLDSTVLLHALSQCPQLQSKLFAVHIHHGISLNADAWSAHCAEFCARFNLSFKATKVRVDTSSNIEEHAREARYLAFTDELASGDALILGHHQDDQAETLLLQLFRGAGVDGLAAMAESSFRGDNPVFRPLLTTSRAVLEAYAKDQGLTWIEDESNLDTHYARNYLRQEVIPLIQNKWPGIQANLARTAMLCQQAQSNLDDLAYQDMPQLAQVSLVLSLVPIIDLDRDRLSNVLRVWLKKNQAQMPSAAVMNCLIQEVIFARTDAMPEVSWQGYEIRRYQHCLYLTRSSEVFNCINQDWVDFPKPLTNLGLNAVRADSGLSIPENAKIEIRFREGGEALAWHGQTKQLKKLFQEWGVPTWLRAQVPLLYINNELAMVVGYAISDRFYAKNPGAAWQVVQNLSPASEAR